MENFKHQPLTKLINQANIDIALTKLRNYGRTNGFHNLYFRQIIYTKLLLLDDPDLKYQSDNPSLQKDQLVKDVNRSLNTICQIKNNPNIPQIRISLLDVLDTIFSLKKNYSYYQGYHDIASVFILTLGVKYGLRASLNAAKYFFKDYLEQDLQNSLTPQIFLLNQILIQEARDNSDKHLSQILDKVPYLSCVIPWILTWFSHSLENINDICRIWDYLLCSPQSAIIYVCAAFLLQHNHLVDTTYEEDIDGNFQGLFQNLSQIENLEIKKVLQMAELLQKKYSVDKLCQASQQTLPPNSLIFLSNFQEGIQYLKDQQRIKQSNFYKIKKFVVKNKFNIICGLGIIGSFAIETILIK